MQKACLFIVLLGFVSLRGTCQTTDDCDSIMEVCSKDGLCVHKELTPMVANDFISPLILMIGIGISNMAGVGGGGITMPVLLVILGFLPSEAVPISNFMIFLGCVTRLIVNFKDKHPIYKHKPAIHFDYMIILLPMALIGTLLGVFINLIFPDLLINIFMVLILCFVSYKSTKKGISLYKTEKASGQFKAPLIESYHQASHLLSTTNQSQFSHPPEVSSFIKQQASFFPLKKLSLIFIVFIGIVLTTLARGGKAGSSLLGVQKCSPLDWTIFSLFLLLAAFCTFLAGRILMNQNKFRKQHELPIDVEWTASQVVFTALISITIGILSGALGLGGGAIMTPLLFLTGQPPLVASLTSVAIMFFTSLSGLIQFIVAGSLDYYYALFNGVFVFIGAGVTIWCISGKIKKSNRQSFLVFLLVGLAMFALISVMVIQTLRTKEDLELGQNILEFKSVCG